jgi:multiple sugar transport system permease protein
VSSTISPASATVGAGTAPRRGGGMRSARLRERLAGYLFSAPAMLLFGAFVAGPVLAALVLSLFRWDILTPARFVGIANYATLFTDPTVGAAFANTAVFCIAAVILHIVLAFALALAVDAVTSRFVQYFVRTTVFFPMLVSWASCALIWKYALDPDNGFINYYLRQWGLNPPNWFQNSAWALPSLIGIDLWRTLGYTFVILLAGLQTVPKQLYEQARIDGAGRWQQFLSVTIPAMSPVLLFTSIISVMGAFQIADPMVIITQGGPGTSTLSAVQLIYYTAFRDFQMGYACAIAVVVAAIIMVVTVVQLTLSRRWVSYDS